MTPHSILCMGCSFANASSYSLKWRKTGWQTNRFRFMRLCIKQLGEQLLNLRGRLLVFWNIPLSRVNAAYLQMGLISFLLDPKDSVLVLTILWWIMLSLPYICQYEEVIKEVLRNNCAYTCCLHWCFKNWMCLMGTILQMSKIRRLAICAFYGASYIINGSFKSQIDLSSGLIIAVREKRNYGGLCVVYIYIYIYMYYIYIYICIIYMYIYLKRLLSYQFCTKHIVHVSTSYTWNLLYNDIIDY